MKSISKFLQLVFLITTLSLMACSSPDPDIDSAGVLSITAVDAEKKYTREEAVIIDVREKSEWDEKHIPGAIHIPLAQLSNRIAELDQYKASSIIMQCHSGMRSAKGAVILHSEGFQKVYNMDGGILAWDGAGLVTESAR